MSWTSAWVHGPNPTRGYVYGPGDDESERANIYKFMDPLTPARRPESTGAPSWSPPFDPATQRFSQLSPDQQQIWLQWMGYSDAPEVVGAPNPYATPPPPISPAPLQVTPLSHPEHILHDSSTMSEKITDAPGGRYVKACASPAPSTALLAPPPPLSSEPVGPADGPRNLVTDPQQPPTAEMTGDETFRRQPWHRRRRWRVLLVLALLAVLAIALGVGLGIGLGEKNNGAVSSPSSGPDSRLDNGKGPTDDEPVNIDREFDSICPKNLCNRTLTAVSYDDKLHIFALGSDNTLYRRVWDYGRWDGGWENLQDDAGPLAGPPVAHVWTPAAGVDRMDVFVVAQLNQNLLGRYFIGGKWSPWNTYIGPVQIRPVLCHVTTSRIDLFLVETNNYNVLHNYWDPEFKNFNLYPHWDVSINNMVAHSAVDVSCRIADSKHDVFIYGRDDGQAWSRSWTGYVDGWTNLTSYGGNFIGDPLVVSLWPSNVNRIDFFGIGADLQLYHFSRDSVFVEPTEMESLGGSLASMPSVTSPADGVFDVVAISTAGRLIHRRYSSGRWSKGWTDLGISSNSAPLVVRTETHTTLMILGRNAELLVTSWETQAGADWKEQVARIQNGGGKFATKFVGI